MITLTTQLAPTPTVQVREVDGEMVVLDTAQNRFAGLDRIGARIWSGLAAGKTPSEVVAELAARYPKVARATLEADVLRLAGGFHARDWMRETAAGDPSGQA